MTYSTAPLEAINTAAEHSGFYIFGGAFLLFMIVALLFAVSETKKEDRYFSFSLAAICGIIIAIIGGISFTTGEYKVYPNEQVIAKRLTFDEVSSIENVGSSKHKRYEEVIRGFVYYKVPEGTVMFRAESGVVYPETAILYKN